MRRWYGPTLAVAMIATAGAGRVPPTIRAIEIVPTRVVVGADPVHATTFSLEARLWSGKSTDPVSIVESDGYVLQWTTSETWLKLVSTSGLRATFELPAGTGPSRTAFVQVSAGGVTTTPGAEIVVDPDGTDMDRVTANYAPGGPPDALVVNGDRTTPSDPCVSVSAFVGRTAVDPLVGACSHDDPSWGAAVLSADHAMVLVPPAWTPGSDPVVDAAAQQGPVLALPVAVRVMVAPDPLDLIDPATLRDSVLKIAKQDIATANSLLAESRAGIRLDTLPSVKVPVADTVGFLSCSEGEAATAAHDAPGALNVYYVNGLGKARGLACDRSENRSQNVIYIGWDKQSGTSLVHEVGHTLGLTLPVMGHIDTIRGLDRTNIMASGDFDTDPGGRRRLTVGQVFRMNTDSASWLNWASNPPGDATQPVRQSTLWPRCRCGADDPLGGCPSLGDDIAPRNDRPDGIHDWDCKDQLQFLGWSGDEEPVAVLAGRRWRTPPGTCRTDLAGEAESHFEATFVRFDNLSSPGKCAAWAVVFFRERGVLFLPLPEATFGFSQIADVFPVWDVPPDRVSVPVHLYYASSERAEVRLAMAHASEEVFGAPNRSGIQLQFDQHENVACPGNDPYPPDVEICYVSTGADEGKLAGRHIDVLGGRTVSTVSYFLGQALGLPPVSDPARSDNAMYTDQAQRGSKLTRSQVLKINAALKPGLCGGPPCPVLSEDVNP